MSRVLVLFFAIGLVGGGCDNGSTATHPDMSMFDAGGADSAMPTPIGGDCTSNAQCTLGQSPQCFRTHTTDPGFCQAKCATNANCGDGATCVKFSDGNFCMRNCTTGADCPTAMACWQFAEGNVCFRDTDLNCDPTVAACTVPVTSVPGGCIREAVGAGKTGSCFATCVAGIGTCPPQGTSRRMCIVFDQTVDFSTFMPTGDAFKGPVCDFIGMESIADGAECLSSDGNHYVDICHEGSECDLDKSAANPSPDKKCHPLCYKAGFTPPMTGFPDGGVPSMTCANCTDAFGLFSTPTPIGLCK
jgi:hypothetical protein